MNQAPARRMLLHGLGLGAAGLVLGGCTRPRKPDAAPAAVELKAAPRRIAPGPGTPSKAGYGGYVVTGWTDEAQSYDPALGYDLHAWEAATSVLYTPLYQFDGQSGGPAPSAAARQPEVSEDGLLYTVRLRPGVRFHNGREVTADDYIYTWTRVLDPAVASWAASYLFSIEGAREVNEGKATSVAGLRRIDDHTLQVRLQVPDLMFPGVLCQPFTAALPREEVRRRGTDFGRRPVGTGPFAIASYDRERQRAVFRRHPYYLWKGTPFIDTLEYRWGIAQTMQLRQLVSGELDVLGGGAPVSLGPLINSRPRLRERYVVPIRLLGTSWIGLRTGHRYLRDPRVRQALNHATDTELLARFTYGSQEAWALPFPKHLPHYERTARPYRTDLAKARLLLAEAGAGGLRLRFAHDGSAPWDQLSQVVQQLWREAGVEVIIEPMSKAALDQAIAGRQCDLFPQHWYMINPNALDLAGNCFASEGSSNYGGYGSKAVDALLAKARASRSAAVCNAHLAEAERLLVDDPPGVFVSSLNFLAARNPRVRNYHMRGETGSYYDRLWVSA
ncbi:ABC transporter substrate-binding protein [Streptomyces formicae]|uniref:ABC transporter substrate-binding protein n=1 Tax=Streptomyces formicae TaxID=1616117 RepID=A0ABY3WM57_9ACTN|nr:ABC transporter substrate-binding protein [Streptomyces formicae]UNM13225.1 ABC transporter substrate-binding protein [Streptomyces formicae]